MIRRAWSEWLDEYTLLVDGVSMKFISTPKKDIEASKVIFFIAFKLLSEPHENSWGITVNLSSKPSTEKGTSLVTSNHFLQ